MWLTCGASFLWIRLLPSGVLLDLMGYVFLGTLILACLFSAWHKSCHTAKESDQVKAQEIDAQESTVFSQDDVKPYVETPDVPTREADVKDAAFHEEDGFSKGTGDSTNE